MSQLFRIREASDLFCDACVRHPQTGELLFLSLYGRDGAVLAFFAAFSLPRTQGGLNEFALVDPDGVRSSVYVNRPDRLKRHTGKLPRNLFGNLVQAWLYDPDLTQPDRSHRTAWGIHRQSQDANDSTRDARRGAEEQTWRQICDLSPVPLAPEWRPWVMDMVVRKRHLTWLDEPDAMFPPLGPVQACKLDLGTGFVEAISEAVRCGELPMPAELASMPALPPRRPAPTQGLPLSLGQVVATPGIESTVPHHRVMACLQRHRHGDWGCLPESDRRANDAALRTGEDRILSAFEIDPSGPTSTGSGANTFWVITERIDAQQTVTTVLLPSEY